VPERVRDDEQRQCHDDQGHRRHRPRDLKRRARAPRAAGDQHESTDRAHAGQLGGAEPRQKRRGGCQR
jgi:hypothetical protein